VTGNRVTDFGAAASDDIDDAVGEARFLEQLSEQEPAHDRGVARGLDDNGVARAATAGRWLAPRGSAGSSRVRLLSRPWGSRWTMFSLSGMFEAACSPFIRRGIVAAFSNLVLGQMDGGLAHPAYLTGFRASNSAISSLCSSIVCKRAWTSSSRRAGGVCAHLSALWQRLHRRPRPRRPRRLEALRSPSRGSTGPPPPWSLCCCSLATPHRCSGHSSRRRCCIGTGYPVPYDHIRRNNNERLVTRVLSGPFTVTAASASSPSISVRRRLSPRRARLYRRRWFVAVDAGEGPIGVDCEVGKLGRHDAPGATTASRATLVTCPPRVSPIAILIAWCSLS